NPILSSMIFITAQFIVQIILGTYFIQKSDLVFGSDTVKYGILGGIAAALATIFFFLAIQQSTLSKVVPIVNMNVVIAVLLGVVFLKDMMNLRIVAGIILAITSIYLLTNG
ncbi:MAG: EamA family transporter, partial [Candidatus Methanoperedens sp.]|nr:EamA family transporter [Candidatus Methanoperedens sp.]